MVPHVISLIFGGANFLFPSRELNKLICKVKSPLEMNVEDSEVRLKLADEYDRCNPVTHLIAM